MFRIEIDKGRENTVAACFDNIDMIRKIEVIQIRLTTGDFAGWVNDMLKFVIERKTWNDLAASIKDGRLDEQLKGMAEVRQKTSCSIILIIEGKLRAEHGHIPKAGLLTKLDHILLRNQAHIVYTDDPADTAARVVAFMDHVEIDVTVNVGGQPTTKAEQADILTKVKEISDESVVLSMINAIPQVSTTTARKIIESKWSILNLYETTAEPISELTYPSGAMLGEARAKKIVDAMGTKKCWIGMLSEINGITKATATKIMAACPDPLLWTETKLAAVVKSEKKKVGTTHAKKIMTLIRWKK